jgi:hypothetical protein
MGPQFIAFPSNPGSSSAYRPEVTAGASLDRFINSHLLPFVIAVLFVILSRLLVCLPFLRRRLILDPAFSLFLLNKCVVDLCQPLYMTGLSTNTALARMRIVVLQYGVLSRGKR